MDSFYGNWKVQLEKTVGVAEIGKLLGKLMFQCNTILHYIHRRCLVYDVCNKWCLQTNKKEKGGGGEKGRDGENLKLFSVAPQAGAKGILLI